MSSTLDGTKTTHYNSTVSCIYSAACHVTTGDCSVCQPVLVSSPAWCSWSDLILYMECWCQARSTLPDEGVGLSGVMSRHFCQMHVYNGRISDLVITQKDWWQSSLLVVESGGVCCVYYLRPNSLDCITCGRWIDIAQVRVTLGRLAGTWRRSWRAQTLHMQINRPSVLPLVPGK